MRNIFHNRKIAIAFSVVIVVLLFVIILNLKPAIVGYSVYQKLQTTNYSLEDYGENISSLKAEMKALEQSGLKLKAELQSALKRLQQTKLVAVALNSSLIDMRDLREKEKKEYELKYSEKVGYLNTELNKLNQEYDELNDDFESLIKSAAKSICCKQKVDNNEINSYDVKHNKIVCSENGEHELRCSFS